MTSVLSLLASSLFFAVGTDLISIKTRRAYATSVV